MEDPYEDSVIIVDPDSSTVTVHDPDYTAPVPKTKVCLITFSDSMAKLEPVEIPDNSTKWPITIYPRCLKFKGFIQNFPH